MTDNEIIKALECCVECDMYCDECPEDCPLKDTNDCTYVLRRNSLDLINRQSAEIDILIRKKHTLRDEIAELQAEIERLQKGYEVEATDNMLLKSENSELQQKIKELEIELQAMRGAANSYKAECERLNLENLQMIASIKRLKSEAIKEFAELVNNRLFKGEKFAYEREYIKNLVKELSEVSDNA